MRDRPYDGFLCPGFIPVRFPTHIALRTMLGIFSRVPVALLSLRSHVEYDIIHTIPCITAPFSRWFRIIPLFPRTNIAFAGVDVPPFIVTVVPSVIHLAVAHNSIFPRVLNFSNDIRPCV